MKNENNIFQNLKEIIYLLFCLFTSIVGYQIHKDMSWAVVNFIFAPFSWMYWLVKHQVNLTIIIESLKSFLQ